MANPLERNPRIFMIVGFACLAASGVFLRLHQDFLAGVGLGAGVASIAVWLFRRNRARRDRRALG